MARIMIIDDDRDIVESLKMILEANGYDVQAKYETGDLIAAVQAENPDLILLDIVFPEDAQAGFKAARELATHASVQHLPVLVLSAVNQLSSLGFSFSEKDISPDFLPVAGFLEKPVQPETLLNRIRELLGQAV